MAAWKGPSGASTRRAWDERIAGQWERPRVLTWHHPRASSLKMLGLSLWEGRLPGQKTIENEDKAAMGSYRPESNFGTSDTVGPLSTPESPGRRHNERSCSLRSCSHVKPVRWDHVVA